jgi:predicted nuclease of predicted toxin-antitoxin system
VRLLLDEMLSPVIARELCARGHDVQAVAGHPEREALSDPDVLALSRTERRASEFGRRPEFSLTVG